MGGGSGGGVGLWGQGGCERRTEVFVKIRKKKIFFFWGGGWVGGGGGGSGNVNQELKFLGKFKKKIWGGGGRGGGSGGGSKGMWGMGGVGLGGQDGCDEELKFL